MKRLIYSLLLVFLLFLLTSDSAAQQGNIRRKEMETLQPEPETMRMQSDNSISAATSDSGIVLPVIKPDFMVNSLESPSGAVQAYPSIAMDSLGNHAVAWMDMRNGRYDCYIQFYDSNDKPLGVNQLIGTNPCGFVSRPVVAANRKGDFVVAWTTENTRVMARIFDNKGHAKGESFQVNSYDFNVGEQISVSVNNQGYFMIAWQVEGGTGLSRLYISLFDPDGKKLAGQMNPLENTAAEILSNFSSQFTTTDEAGNFAVVWSQGFTTTSNIVLQRFDSWGFKLGNNMRINSTNTGRNLYSPSVASLPGGYYLIVWKPDNNSFDTLTANARIYNSNGSFVTGEFIAYSNALTTDGKGRFLTLTDADNKYKIRTISKDGKDFRNYLMAKPSGPDSAYLYLNSISPAYNDRLYVAYWAYGNKKNEDCFLQKFNSSFQISGQFLRVHDDQHSAFQQKPIVCFNNRGESIIIWQDQRNGKNEYFARIFDNSQNPRGDDFFVSEFYDQNNSIAVKALSDGSFAVATIDDPDYINRRIILQIFSPEGRKLKSTSFVANYASKLALNADSQDRIMVAWTASDYGELKGGLKVFYNDLSVYHSRDVFLNYSKKSFYGSHALTVNKNLNIFVCWGVNVNDNLDYSGQKILGQVFDLFGRPVTDTLFVNNIYSWEWIYDVALSDENNTDYAVIWKEGYSIGIKRKYSTEYIRPGNYFMRPYNFGYPFRAQIIEFKNNKLLVKVDYQKLSKACFINDNNSAISEYLLNTSDEQRMMAADFHNNSSCHYHNDTLFFVYESNRNPGTGYDIWAKALKLSNAGFHPEKPVNPYLGDVLFDNYPNPFNAVTRIPYQLNSDQKVKITVYDILGREVKVLLDKYQELGYYEVEFNAHSLPSGVYICRLEAFNTSVKKLLLIK